MLQPVDDIRNNYIPIIVEFTDQFLFIMFNVDILITNNINSVALVHERTIPTERPQLFGEVTANFCG
jgi:hypothetical protein